jgi:hypothetical protein
MAVFIATEDVEMQARLKALLHKGAKVQVYSAHDHPSPG